MIKWQITLIVLSVMLNACVISTVSTDSTEQIGIQSTSNSPSGSYPSPGIGYPSENQASNNALCISPDTINSDIKIGQDVCVQGVASQARIVGNDYVIEFNGHPDSLMVKSHNVFYFGVDGKCITAFGVLAIDVDGRLYVRSDIPGQVTECLDTQ